ncbi:MAG: zinc dependent phospholipase C family protein, partial [Desulfatiglandales bacterium]
GMARVLTLALGILVLDLIFSSSAWAWGAAVHTAIACHILENTAHLLADVGAVIRAYPLEYLYGSLSADFFVGKGQKQKTGHSHNWETGSRCLAEAADDREAAYAYGFLSHLAADVVAHNYFVPNLIHRASTWKRMGHIYWEARVDLHLGPLYTRIAKEVLTMKHLGCDDMLRSAVGKRRQGLKTRRRIYTQSVKLSNYLNAFQSPALFQREPHCRTSPDYISFTVGLSYRLVRDLLKNPETSPCLSFDPIGARNLLIAGRYLFINRMYQAIRPDRGPLFQVDERLLGLL